MRRAAAMLLPMLTPIESRIARLERQNRLLRASFVLGAIALVTCGGITANYERVNTRTLVIVSAPNEPKITLAANGITFHDTDPPVVLDATALAELRKILESGPRE
jgi:hypothetical protein